MSQRLEFDLEQEYVPSEHSASDEEEERMLAALAKLEQELTDELAARMVAQRLICSCGFFTCGAIGTFGHPVPVFKEDIEPLWPQPVRDQRALQLKGAGSN